MTMTPTRVSVIRPGLFTTVQDLGRVGYQRFGVSVAGAMDPWALRCANRLVGNPDHAAALEITVLGPELFFEQPAVVALTGGEFAAWVDGVSISGWCALEVPAGGTLKIGGRRVGARGYLGIAGGIAVQPLLNSCSTHVRSGMGGVNGVALRKGDMLDGGLPSSEIRQRIGRALEPTLRPAYSSHPTVRVVSGPQLDAFRPEAVETFQRERYTLSQESDRMGYRLVGAPLAHRHRDIVSDATPLGTVQVPAGEQPILLMADRQTTGGYPKIAVVISSDIPLAAQLMPGDTIGFTMIEAGEARHILREQYRRLETMLPPVRT